MRVGLTFVVAAILAIAVQPTSAQPATNTLSIGVVVAPSCRVAVASSINVKCSARAEQSLRTEGKELVGKAGERSFEVRHDGDAVVHLNF